MCSLRQRCATCCVSLLTIVLLFAATQAHAESVFQVRADYFADFRAYTVDGEPSWLEGGFGKGRYGGHDDLSTRSGFTLAELSALIDVDITWDLTSFVHLQYAGYQDKPIDLIEAFLHWRPVSTSAIAFDLKGGLYFPHISRENSGPAWSSPYSITASAANSWVGEEIRALGVQGGVTWRGDVSKVHLSAAMFGFNDPAGTLLAWRGWAINDIKVGAFGRLPVPPIPSIGPGSGFIERQPNWVHPVRELDGRLGWHAGLDWDYGENISIGGIYYDNGGDPVTFEHEQYGWDTRFYNAYIEVNLTSGMTVLTQYMSGVTIMGPDLGNGLRPVDVDFSTGFLLLSQKFGPWRVSGRGEVFETRDNSFVVMDNNNEEGTSFMLGVARNFGDRDQVLLEVLQIDSERPFRPTLGYEADQKQTLIQGSYRKLF